MGIFNNTLEINRENPFINDKLHREEEVKNLTSMFEIVDNQMVLAVNSRWGTGKSTFLKMWEQYLLNNGYTTAFINAWESDYVDEAFIAFVNEIRESINDEDKVRGFISMAKDVSLALVKQSPKIVSKVIKEKTGFDSEQILSDDDLNQIVSDKIDDYNKNKNSVDKFKEELKKVADKQFEETGKPFIIFVDELDRCRPNYAISLLERIKHFFIVPNIIFILGIDKEALSNSIRVIYGEQTDITGYLSRFIDLEYTLKESGRKEFVYYLLYKYEFDKIFENRRLNDSVPSTEHTFGDFIDVMIEIINGFKLSLRDIEKFVIEIYMIIKANINKCIYPDTLMMLCVIKRINKTIYNRIKSCQISYEELISFLKQHNEGIKNWLEEGENCIFKAYLLWLIKDYNEINRLNQIVENLEENNKYTSKELRCLERYNWVSEGRAYWMFSHNEKGIKEEIFKMVELYDNFTTITDNK